MKTRLLIHSFLLIFIYCIFGQKTYCQEVTYNTTNQFYYNSFDNGSLGVFNNYIIPGTANQTITTTTTTTAAFNGTIALTSVPGVNSKNNIHGQILPLSDRDLNNNEFEWTFLYKNNSATSPIEPYDNGLNAGPTVAGQAAWQYWLTANDKDQTLSTINGFYMTQVGTNMILRYRVNQNDIQSLITFPVTNNVLWTIKIQRIYTAGSCAWRIWANPVVGSNYEASQYQGIAGQTAFNNYVYSMLAVTDVRAAGNNFYFDNIKLYTRRLSFTSINAAANGITQPSFYPSQPNAVLYGLKVNTRGTYNFNSLNIGVNSSTGTNVNAFFGSTRIVRSIDDNYNTTVDNTTLATFSPQSMPIQTGTFSTVDNTSSSGNADGSSTNVSNYFLVTNMLSTTADPKFNYGNPGPYTTFTITGPSSLTTTENNNNPPNGSFVNNASTGNNPITFTATAPPPAGPTIGVVNPLCGAGTASIKASGGTPSGGTYDWYNAATGGVLLQSSTSDTYAPFVGGTTIFYAAYTVNGVSSSRTAVTVTVNPKVSSSITAPVLSWPFNGNSNDISGNANHGLLQNAPTLTTDRNGVVNSAYNFNGSNTFIVATTGFTPTPLVFSLSIWFKTTTAGGMLVGMGGNQTSASNATHDRHIYMSSTGQLYFGIYDGSVKTVNTGTSTFSDGLWHHAVATCGPTGGLKLYVDGVLRSSPLAYTTPQNTGGFWRIGGDNVGGWTNSNNNYFNGTLDDFVVYNHELTATEAVDNDLNQYTFTSSYCANNPLTIGAPVISGATYSWVDNSNSSNTSNVNPAVFTSATKSSYTLTVTANGCSSVSTVTPITPTFTWTGAGNSTSETLNTNWFNTTTGVANVAPSFTGTESLVIPAGLSVYPVLTNNRSVYSLTIATGASLSLNGKTLNVGCNIINSNTTASGIVYGPVASGNTDSEIIWGGSVLNQSYAGTATTVPAQFGKMTINNTNASTGNVNIESGSLNIYNLLTMTKGKLAVNASANLTLKSTSNLTASVPALGTGTSITGNVTVERWFTGGQTSNRGWRLMSMPVNNTGDIPASSASLFNFSSLQKNLYITGAGTNFDATAGPTILFYNTSTKLFTYPSDPTVNGASNKVGTGFYFYFRGDKTNPTGKLSKTGNPLAYVAPELNVVGLQTGTLNQGSITYTLSNGGNGYNLIGNPYPSTINVPSGGGANAVFPGTTGFIYTYTSGASSISPVAAATVNIASGQGFFVKTSSTSTGPYTAAFTESLKTTAQLTGGNLLLGKPVGIEEPILSIKMVQDSANYDIVHLRFLDTYKNDYDQMEDADDLNASGQNAFLGVMTADNHQVAIASQPLDKKKTSVFLTVNDNYSGLYTIQKMNLAGIPEVYDVWLMDHFKNDSLDLRANDTYKFNLDKNNPSTFGAARFEVVIRLKSLPPYSLISFNGQKTGTDVVLKWNTKNEYNYTSFELQKSADGTNFEAVRNMRSSSQGSYDFKDIYNSSSTSTVYYRLKQVDINDVVYYSNLVIITPAKGNGTFAVFPNPATNTIQFSLDQTLTSSSVRLSIFNTMGLLMKSSTFTATTGQQDVSNLIPGNYTIEVTDLNTKKPILTGKFIKL